MTLEHALAENTKAIQELTKALINQQYSKGAATISAAQINLAPGSEIPGVAPVTSLAPEDALTGAIVGREPKKTKAPKAEPVEVIEPAPVSEPVVVEVTYDNVVAAVLDLQAKKGREASVQLLASFGASKGQDLKKEQYAAIIAAAKVAAE